MFDIKYVDKYKSQEIMYAALLQTCACLFAHFSKYT